MSKVSQTSMLAAIALLLVAILATLITIAWRGVQVEHTGAISLETMLDGIPLRMEGPVMMQNVEPVHMVTTGPTGEAIPVELAFLECHECGGTLVPVRWNPFTGDIEWSCPTCERDVAP